MTEKPRRKPVQRMFAFGLLLISAEGLCACTAAQLAGLGGLGAVLPPIVQVGAAAVGITPPVLTDAARGACAAQAAFNAAGKLAEDAGAGGSLLSGIAAASSVAGDVCTW